MLLNQFNLFKSKINLNNLNLKNKLKLENKQIFSFSRLIKPQNKFVHIYPKDNVVVLPAFTSLKNLSSFDQRKVKSNSKYDDLSKIQHGRVIKIFRKKNLAIVSGVNRKEKFVNPREYITLVERGDLHKVRRRFVYSPVNLSRLRLRDLSSAEIKPLKVKIVTNEEGKKQRVDATTNNIIEKPVLSKTYASRVENKKTGPKDTLSVNVLDRTFVGIDYTAIAREFLNRIKEKKTIESNLIFKDK